MIAETTHADAPGDNNSARAVLAALADGRQHSGQQLANRLGVTRAAIWKQIRQLRQQGLPVAAGPGRGYQLPWPVELLDRARILRDLTPEARVALAGLAIDWRPASTSDVLHQRAASFTEKPQVVLAESQSAGRGRRGRSWLAPPGLNICLSLGLRFDRGAVGLAGLSLAVGVILLRALADVGCHQAGLKWPNDILAGDGKLAGILVEMEGEYGGPCNVIVGIGLNLRMPETLAVTPDQPVAELARLVPGQGVSRNALVAIMIGRLVEGLAVFRREGFAAFAAEYARHDLLHGKDLRMVTARGEWFGQGAGIDARGALKVNTPDGQVRVDSAQVTVRSA